MSTLSQKTAWRIATFFAVLGSAIELWGLISGNTPYRIVPLLFGIVMILICAWMSIR
jgi:hypothetical protein